MPHKIVLSCLITSFLFILSFMGYQAPLNDNTLSPDQGRKEHQIAVKIIDDEWRVVLADDDSKSDVLARRGDRIRWVVEGSDATFTFPNRGILGHRTRKVKDGNPLVLPVLDDSPLGEFDYTVYIKTADAYARGQSPPRIIIKE